MNERKGGCNLYEGGIAEVSYRLQPGDSLSSRKDRVGFEDTERLEVFFEARDVILVLHVTVFENGGIVFFVIVDFDFVDGCFIRITANISIKGSTFVEIYLVRVGRVSRFGIRGVEFIDDTLFEFESKALEVTIAFAVLGSIFNANVTTASSEKKDGDAGF
jgi:hypothetical protein